MFAVSVLREFLAKWKIFFSYRQAQMAVERGIGKLHKLGISTRRPEDFYAEMAKSDVHMKKAINVF